MLKLCSINRYELLLRISSVNTTMNSSSFPFFIFAVVIVLRLSSTRALTCHPDDEAGLLDFKAGITRDSLGVFSNWEKGTACCSWNGVICNNDRVTELQVWGRDGNKKGIHSLSGTISPSLAKLQHLERVSFMNLGKIKGSFPQFIFKLPKLKFIDILGTRLSGPLPTNMGKLEELRLVNNRFTGPIPTSLSNLTLLNLADNRLSGTIPDIFNSLTSLTYLSLSQNRFVGKLPPSIASLAPTLSFFDVSQNSLSGTIPNYLSRFKRLSLLDLSSNQFSGVVPMDFTNLTSLYNFNISRNLLTGPFPTLSFATDGGLSCTLDLSYNKFQLKTIPKWVTSSQLIGDLKLAKCGIKMKLDDWKPKINQSFAYVDLSENDILGSPVRFVNHMDTLQEFKASGNKLRFNLGKLNFTKSLTKVDLSRNLIFGKVPASVAGLEMLNLSHNHLCGKLPLTKFPASVFAGNDCLCGSPLPPCKT